ncbi:PREDICTED: single-stranded DNA-binding protein 3-like [Corvus brachyrhynchos]|uniref:single-stranded DNA-binding protein 3-like n=1 Tax=Corvus brachyrhynchos TaxID=85066 RepID=UPI0008163E49|nr:PREDICTED: single-stranded DNA-binding protein 3-like [Corvus brachyrhynchos]
MSPGGWQVADTPSLSPCCPPRLALYVYEYLLHVGAQKSAQTFLSEIRWEKNITLGEPPGFLHSWWCSRGPGGRGPWPNPNANSIAYSSSSPGNYVGPPGGGGPPGTPILPSPGDSTNSSENMYTMMNPIGPAGNRPNFPMGPGPEGPMGGMSAMEPHHMNGSLGSGDMDGLPKVSWGPWDPLYWDSPPCTGPFP